MPENQPLDPPGIDYLPLSCLNQLCYCPRRFWYMLVLGEMEENAAVLEGTLQHERIHQPGSERISDLVRHRRVWVHSDRLRIVGMADLVEETDGRLKVVEHKRGRQGRWNNDRVQLCAQALCLEESAGRERVARCGEIFYWRSRRRVEVEFTRELREQTEQAATLAFELLAAGRMPPHTAQRARCRGCSLEPICLPAEVTLLNQTGGAEP